MTRIVPLDGIAERIVALREHRVMLSGDLAELYGVEAKALVQAAKRNVMRFPDDFMFQLSAEEFRALRSQISKHPGRGGVRHPPLAFTEHGVAMLSSVLKSNRAVEVNIAIVRAFVQLRQQLSSNKELSRRLGELEEKCDAKFSEHDKHLRVVFEAIQQLLGPPPSLPRRQLGFVAPRPFSKLKR